ncbi:uncharacterized protein LAJ45_04442 [Morchella importuna]|uniref:uncharacterized protein n=1 Tax=Morchella importuna TaxID=1174673 RepID=UPI001E8E17AC|nr:uncharacterized protein LAJ45_04442 [Morchella importuna]KAH8151240.1 hypothetical protein LAJ45_04442 [Morchella importuna]
MFRNIRNFLSHSRIPVRISAQSDKYKLYRVRFVPQDKRFNGLFRGLLLLSGCHIAANTLLQTFGSGWEEPLFIPLGFLEEGPRRRYELTDPEFQAFLKFNKDTKKALAARAKVIEILVKNLEANNRSKFGGDVKAEGSILYYHYPIGPPPEYIRKGLLISPAERDSSDQSEGASHPLRLSNLKYEWVSGNNLVVGIDIIASFDPETLGSLIPPQFHPLGGKTTLVEDPTSKGTVQEAIQSSEEIRRRTVEQQRNFIDKQVGGVKAVDQKRVIQEPKVQDKGPESVPEIGVKPIVRMLKGKRGESIPDIPPGGGASERGDDKKQETDVDDATSSKP